MYFLTETLIIISHYLKLHKCNGINIMSMRDCILYTGFVKSYLHIHLIYISFTEFKHLSVSIVQNSNIIT